MLSDSKSVVTGFFSELPWVDHGFGTRNWTPEMGSMATLRQIHSDRILAVDQPGCAGEGDGLITSCPGLALAVRTADCYPVLVADERTRVAGVAHAGWRGTAAGITGRLIREMQAQFRSNPVDIWAAIGPGIGACCYEVGEQVARQFGLDQRGKIDLARANREQLIQSGVPQHQIRSIDRCTFCEPDIFYSYRREADQAGRMISFIRVRPAG